MNSCEVLQSHPARGAWIELLEVHQKELLYELWCWYVFLGSME